ncbi:hypothetical protein MKI84_11075 [Ancylobacter sp. A5.8]|uniref:hypothetical protein n=1 Tax=Ancylobacter gelatini TaxID=2919920 RepID=UPI001F4ECACC|nr:hypothetical protein [Ancylobacter gelatini]MCJ8143457.1 hypothetical protein [Ancylobacter gelatini]
MKRSLPLFAALAALVVGLLGPGETARADSTCAQTVVDTQAAVDRIIADRAASGPSAPEGDTALLSEDPSPDGMAKVEGELGDGTAPEKALAALERARKADAAGDTEACQQEVAAARDAVGLQ